MSEGAGRGSGELRLELIACREALMRIEPEWRALLEASDSAGSTLDPTWLSTWWRYYSTGRRLAVGCFWHGELLVGLVPLCSRTFRYFLGLQFRRLEFLGGGCDEVDDVSSDYLAPIARRGFEVVVARFFVQSLASGGFGGFDECVLEMMDADQPIVHELRAALADSRLALEESVMMEAPFMNLPADWDAFLEAINRKRRNSLRSAMRHFEEWAAPTGYELHFADDAPSLDLGLDILSHLHAERWRQSAGGGVFSSGRFSSFHREYAARALRDGQLWLAWLTVGREPVAAIYCWTFSTKIYFYQSGRKMGLPPRIRIGIVILILFMQRAIREGMTEFDFLGGNAQYKAVFTDRTRQLVRFRLARSGLRESLRKSAVVYRRRLINLVRRPASANSN